MFNVERSMFISEYLCYCLVIMTNQVGLTRSRSDSFIDRAKTTPRNAARSRSRAQSVRAGTIKKILWNQWDRFKV